jgi:hypothetical protein
MSSGLLADLLVVVHFGFVLFVVLGGVPVLWWPRVAWVHVPSAVWGAWIEFAGWTCPLTPLENRLRMAAGQAGYDSSFVEHYLMPVLYPASLTRELQWLLGGAVVGVNAVVYVIAWRRSKALHPTRP